MTKDNNIFEFPEDKHVVHLNLSDYDTHFTEAGGSRRSSKTSLNVEIGDSPFTTRFNSSLVCVVSIGFMLMLFSISKDPASSFGCLIATLILREWNRIHGMVLTRQPRASINYASVLREQKDYIPFYRLEWLFGKRYEPYYYGCTGPSINGDVPRTPDGEENSSKHQSELPPPPDKTNE